MPVLARKPGALRNGAPFKDWELPAGHGARAAQLAGADRWHRQFVDILAAVLDDGLEAVEAACAEAVAAHGVQPPTSFSTSSRDGAIAGAAAPRSLTTGAR